MPGIKKTTTKKVKKTVVGKKTEKPKIKKERYFEGLGRRKTAIARVRLLSLSSSSSPSLRSGVRYLINGKSLESYFSTNELRETVLSPLKKMECLGEFGLSVKVRGGGISAQAEAIRHGVARALVLFNPDFRKKLKKAGYLKRDPRMRERKKFGLKRARRAPQWQKR